MPFSYHGKKVVLLGFNTATRQDQCGFVFHDGKPVTELWATICYVENNAEAKVRAAELVIEPDEPDTAKSQTAVMLSHINSPASVARRGTVLTPHGWRKVEELAPSDVARQKTEEYFDPWEADIYYQD